MLNRSSTCHATSDEDREGFYKITQKVGKTQDVQRVWRQDPAANRQTNCEHAWWYWKCTTLKIKQIVHTVEIHMLKILKDKWANQVRKSRNPWV